MSLDGAPALVDGAPRDFAKIVDTWASVMRWQAPFTRDSRGLTARAP